MKITGFNGLRFHLERMVNFFVSIKILSGLTAICCLFVAASFAQTKTSKQQEKNTAYLFVYFTGNDSTQESIRFALSKDGYNFRALNGNQPVINSKKISSTGGVRDPHILRGQDGKTFYMVATDMVAAKGWNSNRAMVLLKSTDLVNWTSSVVNIQQRFPGNDNLLRVWAPETIYDPATKKCLVYFSMKHGNEPDKIYYAYANDNFTDLETVPKQLFFSPNNGACIDGDIVYRNGLYHLVFKTEEKTAGLKIAVSKTLTGDYVLQDRYIQQTNDPVEGAGMFKLNNSEDYILMYDLYTKGKYQFTKTSDLEHFAVVDNEVTMDFHPRHGTVMPITSSEASTLVSKWGVADDLVKLAASAAIKKRNIALNTTGKIKQLILPVKPGTNLSSFDPEFISFPGVKISPVKSKNFVAGDVTYTVTINGKPPHIYAVSAREYHNPVLDGFYADPDILYSEKTKKFYLYPTSDGFNNWSGTYFKTFSSADLVNWKDEGIILDLAKDVKWANRNAWAPCIIEKKINGQYKYFFYFTAAQKIGVAVADNPAGPFTDSGKPLIDKLPDGVKGGQQIDPEVFSDPKTGRSYLHWGNGYMAGAELNDDMVSIKTGTTKLLTPNASFREGTTVFYRNGLYYFLWSEDDTRSPNYKVRYGTAESPLGKISIPANNLVIAKDSAAGIYGTGHNSVIQIPGRDEWYIVYHRFNYPNGIKMGDAAGYNREVCIDKLEFNADNTIRQTIPTHAGIKPIHPKK